MPFPSALTTDQLHTLRGDQAPVPSYHAVELVAFLPNTINFQATISADSPVVGSTAANSYAQVSFSSVTVGAYTDIVADQVILIGLDIRNPVFVGRAIINNSGVVATSSTVNISETSAPVFSGMTIWGIWDFRVTDRLARAVTSGNTVIQKKDYYLDYQLSPPFVTGLQSAYAAVCDSTDKITLSFAPSATAITYAATISSWLWTVPSGMTITVGSTTTQNITATFDSGFSDWVFVQVTDSNGKTGIFRFWVVSIAQDYANVTVFVTGGLSFNASDNQGYSATIPAFAGVADMLDNTLMLAVDVEYYNGVEASIGSNLKFTGRIRIETNTTTADEAYGLLKKTDYELEHVTDTLARIEHLPFTLTTKTSPTVWDQLTNLTLPRAIAYCLWWHSTVLTLHSFSFDNFIQTWAYPILPTQGGNILAIIQDLAFSYNAVFETAPTGECVIHRNALFLSGTERNALTTVANFTSMDWTDFQVAIAETDDSGKVQASGGVYNSKSGTVTPLLSLAPGAAQGVGQNVNNFARQVLQANQDQRTAQAELNTRAGNQYAIVQKKQPIATVTFPPGYNFIVPDQAQWYTFTIDASYNTGGRAYTTSDRWLCQSINVAQDNSIGSKQPITATFVLESIGFRGQTITYPAPTSVKPSLPSIPTIPSTPSLPPLPAIYMPPTPTITDNPPYVKSMPKGDGNTVVTWSATQAWVTNNFLLTSDPTWIEITPPNALAALTCFQWVGNGRPDGYLLSNNGLATSSAASRFHYTENVFANPPVWIDTDLAGILYSLIRVNATSGKVYIEGQSFTDADCTSGWIVSFGTELGRTTTTIDVQSAAGSGVSPAYLEIEAPTIDTCVLLSYEILSGGSVNPAYIPCGLPIDAGNEVFTWVGEVCANFAAVTGLDPFSIRFHLAPSDGCGTCGVTTTTDIAYSSDFGATFASPQTLSSSLSGDVGFDTIKIGAESIVAEVGQIDISTTDGGAYSAYGSALPADTAANAIWISRYAFGSTTSGNINDTTPELLIASGALSSGNESLWKVTASGATLTSITINDSGNYGLAISPNCIAMPYKSGKKIAVIELFDTTRKLYVSSTSGAGWTSRGAVGDTADYIRFRENDLLCSQLFWVDSVPKVSQNFGSTIQSKNSPTDSDLIGIEPYSST